jgi:parvulin-like peptidyl-prolyl isomerase
VRHNQLKIGVAAALASALVIILSACGNSSASGGNPSNDDAGTNTAQNTPVPALPLNESGQQLVAVVNGEEITLGEFERAFQRQSLLTEGSSYDALANDVLTTLIEQRLINQAAGEMGISVTDEEIEAELNNIRDLRESDADWQSWLDQNYYTEDELRQSLREALLTQRAQAEVVQVSSGTVTEVHARHIVVPTEAESNDILARLNAGEDFGSLAAAHSIDVTSRDSGGDLGWFTRDDLLTPELADAAFDMQINEVRGPVQTMLGYHILQLLEVQQRSAEPDEEVQLAADQFNDWLQSLLNDAEIERYIN